MRNINDTIDLEIEFYLHKYNETKDVQFAIHLMELITSGKALIKRNSNNLMYCQNSKFKNKCSRCGKYYNIGEPAFYYAGVGKEKFHERCATEEEKLNNTFYQKCLKESIKPISVNKDSYEEYNNIYKLEILK